MAFNREQARKDGWTDEEIDAFLAQSQPQQQFQQQGGVLQGAANLSNFLFPRTTQTVTSAVIGGIQPASQTGIGQFLPNPKFIGETIGAAGELAASRLPFLRGVGGLAGRSTAAGVIHGATTPNAPIQERAISAGVEGVVGGVVGKASSFLPLTTKRGTAKATEKAAAEATAQGKGVNWNELQSKITQSVKSKFGERRDVQNALDNLLVEKTPSAIQPPYIGAPAGQGSTTGTFLKTPSELLDWRRQLTMRQGGGIFKLLGGKSISDKVEGQARTIISEEIHRMVPKSVTPDKLYSIYSNLHGDVPAQIRNLVAFEIGRRLLGKVFNKATQEVIGGGSNY